MDQATRHDIAAAAAAHSELGREYDDAVAQSLVDRIGAEIDKRIDARLTPKRARKRSLATVPRPRRPRLGRGETLIIGAVVGAVVTGIGSMAANHGQSPDIVPTIITIWLILAVIGLAIALVSSHRARSDD